MNWKIKLLARARIFIEQGRPYICNTLSRAWEQLRQEEFAWEQQEYKEDEPLFIAYNQLRRHIRENLGGCQTLENWLEDQLRKDHPTLADRIREIDNTCTEGNSFMVYARLAWIDRMLEELQ